MLKLYLSTLFATSFLRTTLQLIFSLLQPSEAGGVEGKGLKRHHVDPRKVSSQLNIQKHWNNQNPEREDISDLIRNRMKSLDLTLNDYCELR